MTKIPNGKLFAYAVCKHFGLPPIQVPVPIKVNTLVDEGVSIELKILLSPDDLAAIGEILKSTTADQAPKE